MDTTSDGSYDIDWTTEDELDATSSVLHQEHIVGCAPSSSCSFPSSKTIDEFLLMGFSMDMVIKAIKENGLNDKAAVVDALLSYSLSDLLLSLNTPSDTSLVGVGTLYQFIAAKNVSVGISTKKEHVLDGSSDDEKDSNYLDSLSDEEIYGNEESTNSTLKKDTTVSLLVEMGYQAEYALAAIDRCGVDTPIEDLIDMIVAEMANDAPFGELFNEKELRCDQQRRHYMPKNKRKFHQGEDLIIEKHEVFRRQRRSLEKQPMDEDDERLHLPKPMIGFGIPNHRPLITERSTPNEAKGSPYFYYENVALAPKGVWDTISRFLYSIVPEFLDSKFICAAARKRGYIHNLPIENRFQLLPIPPTSIHEAFPHTKEFWPSWDTRTKLNCILTCVASAKLTDRIKAAVEKSGGPSTDDKVFVIEQCKKWNLIWVGRNIVAPLEPDEMEMLMGFPRNHTRGGGITRTERYTVLGNAFQVDTVAYHLSVLKDMFPDGLNVLSLFSGIGGAEVALYRLGICLKNVVSVDISEACRKILQTWWVQTNQQGNLIHFHDVQKITRHHVETWISNFGGFDLIIGGSPCNNLAGGNRHSRNGLEGEKSVLFFEYYRVTDLVRSLMRS